MFICRRFIQVAETGNKKERIFLQRKNTSHIKCCKASSAYTANYQHLYTSLTLGYNAYTRPDSTVPITVSLVASSINILDTTTEQFSVTGWFSLSWTDTAYYWNPSTYNNIEYLFLTKDNCWRPSVAIYNAADDVSILNDDESNMRVKSDGTVLWEPGGVFIVKCHVDARNFPFDKQECSLSLSILVYDDTEVTIAHYTDKITFDGDLDTEEWTITSTSTETDSRQDGRQSTSKTLLRFTFKFERNSSFYVWTLLVPYVLISSLGLIVFILPTMSGEKLSFSTTVIFLVLVYFIIFSTMTPLPSGKIPITGVFFFLLLLLNLLELLTTAMVERMRRNENEERPVSSTVQTIANNFLSRLSCYRNRDENNSTNESYKNKPSKRLSMPKNTRVSPSSLQSISPVSIRPRKPDIEFDRIKSGASTRTSSDITVSTDASSASSTRPLQYNVVEYSWEDIATMVDRIAFAVFLLLFLSLTSIFVAILHASIV